jgi:hypothetical protein
VLRKKNNGQSIQDLEKRSKALNVLKAPHPLFGALDYLYRKEQHRRQELLRKKTKARTTTRSTRAEKLNEALCNASSIAFNPTEIMNEDVSHQEDHEEEEEQEGPMPGLLGDEYSDGEDDAVEELPEIEAPIALDEPTNEALVTQSYDELCRTTIVNQTFSLKKKKDLKLFEYSNVSNRVNILQLQRNMQRNPIFLNVLQVGWTESVRS